MLQICLVLLLSAHLLLVNLAMGGPLACLWLEWRATRHGDVAASLAGERLVRASLLALAVAIVLGMGMLAVLWWSNDQRYFAALAMIPKSRLWFSLAELVFYFVTLGAYLLWWRSTKARWFHRSLAVLAATDLMLHFPPLFVMVATLAGGSRPEIAELDRAAYHALLIDPQVVSRVLHVWLASIAVAGAWLMLDSWRLAELRTLPAPSFDARRIAIGGARFGLAATVLQVPVGLWVLLELPALGQNRLLGGDPLDTSLLAISLLAALALLYRLAAAALGDVEPNQVRRTCGLLALVVVLMTGAMTRGDRHARTKPASLRPAHGASSQLFDGPRSAATMTDRGRRWRRPRVNAVGLQGSRENEHYPWR